MQILSNDQIQAWLQFRPRQIRPAPLPSYSWRGTGVVGTPEAPQVIDLSEGLPSDVFLMAYPKIGLDEAAQIYLAWKRLLHESESNLAGSENWVAFWPEICAHNGWRNDSVFTELLSRLAQTPNAFQEWVNVKGIQPGDLLPLNSLPDLNTVRDLLEKMAEVVPSRSTGKQLLELGVELILMGETLPESTENPEAWLTLMRELRYPRTSQQDKKLQAHLESLSVPKGVQLRGVRLGDRNAVEIRLTVHSGRDLENKLQQVQKLANHLTPESEQI